METKYSVLMSVYYKEKHEFLRLSIKSMLTQTLKPDQIVIVKDGKLTKELNELIEQFILKEANLFSIIELKNNIGLGLALNEGLKYCRNELVVRMDSDDISLPERCELQIKEFENDFDLDIIGSCVYEFIDDPSCIISSRKVPIEYEDIYRFAKRRNAFNHPTVVYKKSKVLSVGGYSAKRRGQDMDLFARMLYSGCKAKNITQPLLLFRVGDDSAKRRKNWKTTKNRIEIMHGLWKIGFSSFVDFLLVSIAQLFIFSCPILLQNWIYNKFLRN